MAQTPAIRAVQAIYQHVDDHVRELLPPPPGPEVEDALMILTGSASGAATFGGTTAGTVIGAGPCPALPEFGGTIMGSWWSGWQKVATYAAPHGWTSFNYTARRAADGISGHITVGHRFENAAGATVGHDMNEAILSLLSGGTDTIPNMLLGYSASSNDVRQVSLWSRTDPDIAGGPTAEHAQTVYMSGTFNGICEDIETPLVPATGVIGPGMAGIWSFDYKARITGWYIQEFDGTSGSIQLALEKASRGASPPFASIVASAPPTIVSGRYGEDATLANWDTTIDRGDLIRVSVTSASGFTRLLFGLRIRRLEPYG